MDTENCDSLDQTTTTAQLKSLKKVVGLLTNTFTKTVGHCGSYGFLDVEFTNGR